MLPCIALVLAVVFLFGYQPKPAYADMATQCVPTASHPNPCHMSPCMDGYVSYNCFVRPSLKDLFTMSAILILAANAAVECLVALGFVLLIKKSKKIIWVVLVANLISWPIFYVISNYYPYDQVLVIGELAIWLAEAAGIYVVCRKLLNPGSALLLSTLTNGTTLLISIIAVRVFTQSS